MTRGEFLAKRPTFTWGTMGRNHNEPLRNIRLEDITDSHLVHIIGWVLNNKDSYELEILHILMHEARYRSEQNIYIEENQKTSLPKLKL